MAASERLFSVPASELAWRQLPDVLREILLHRLPFRERRTSLEKAEVIEEQLAMQMIDLVLQAAREQISCLELERFAITIECAHGDFRRALDVAEHFRNRETAFFALR